MYLKFKYKIDDLKNDVYTLTILEQDKRIGDKYLDKCNRILYVAKNGIEIRKAVSIEVSCNKYIYILGSDDWYGNNYTFRANSIELQKLKEALEEFRLEYCRNNKPNHRLTHIFQ